MINSNYLWRIGYWLRGHRIRSKHFFLPPDHPKPEVTPGTLEDYFWNNEGPIVQKWLHYLPVYEKYLRRYVGKPVRFLEIGVFRGGSLQLWRKYLGDDAILYGIDIEPSCKALDGQSGQVRIGSQDDQDPRRCRRHAPSSPSAHRGASRRAPGRYRARVPSR